MIGSRTAPHPDRLRYLAWSHHAVQVLAIGGALLVVLGLHVRSALAEALPGPDRPASSPSSSAAAQNQPQLVFTMGVVARLGRNTVTLRFEDGQTETYQVTDATAFQTETGGAATAADLDVGDMVMIISPENASTAITIVDAGDRGFDAGGPFDIGTDEGG